MRFFLLRQASLCLLTLFFAAGSFGQSWKQRGSDIPGKNSSEGIGGALSLSSDGKIVAIGASGANSLRGLVRVYEWSGTSWSQKGSDINGATTDNGLGFSVSLDSTGKTLAIGSPNSEAGFGQYSNSGLVKVYTWNGTSWSQKGSDILAKDSADGCGNSVSLSHDGTILAIGSPAANAGGIFRGHVRIFKWNGTAWVQRGGDINGEGDYDLFGNTVSLDATGTKLAIGAPFNSGAANTAGRVRVYSWNGSSWVSVGSNLDGDADSDNFGYSVSLSDNGLTLAAGAPQDFLGGYGYAKIYTWNGSSWTQKGSNITSSLDGDEFGYNISLSGNGGYLAIGARNSATGNEKGRGEVYTWNSTAWQRYGDTIKGKEDYSAQGQAVAFNYSGDILAIGAPVFNGTGSSLGDVQVYHYTGPCSATYSTTTMSACGTYTWNSKNYTASGTYKDTIPNAGGCDSVMTLNLTILTPKTQTMATGICGNDPYTSPSGKKYNATGVYSDTLRSKSGCDSIIYTITVTKKIPNVDGFVLKDSTMTAISEGAVTHGDVDNDGDQDILIAGKDAGYGLIAEIYTNDGSGNFTKMAGTNFTGAANGSVSLVDMNGDNIPEVYITGLDKFDKPVAYLYQAYQGSYLQVTSTPFDKLAGTKHTFADVDKDGDQDLIISSGDSLFLYKNHLGDFLTAPAVVTNSNANNGFILTGDLNGDGYIDIVKGGSDMSKGSFPTELLINDKTGKFTKASDPFDDLVLSSGTLADFNADGKTDFIETGLGKGLKMVTRFYTNDGNGGFTNTDSTSIKGFAYGSTIAEDFNNDGRQDLLMTGNSDFQSPQSKLYIRNSKGNFVIASNLPVALVQMSSATAFDMDKDGLKDLLVAGQDPLNLPTIRLYKNKGCFAPCESESEINVKECGPYTSPSGNYIWTQSGTYTDIIKNAAGCDSTITIHLTTNSAATIAAVACDSFITPSGKVIRKSGLYIDTLKSGNHWGCDSIIRINLNISSAQLISKVILPEATTVSLPGAVYSDIVVSDLNGDNKPDIIISGYSTGFLPTTKIFRNNGGNSFTEMTNANLTGVGASSISVGDVDGDNKPDILISGSVSGFQSLLKLYKNEGGFNFTEMTNTNLITSGNGAVAIADLDGDNKPDILTSGEVSSGEHATKLYKNNGGGSFSEITAHPFPKFSQGRIEIGDVDADGKADILLNGYVDDQRVTKLYKNNGGFNFSEMTNVVLPGIYRGSMKIVDLDADGKPDILLVGDVSKIYKNNGAGNFSEMNNTKLFEFLGRSFGEVGDINGDNKPDILLSGCVDNWVDCATSIKLYLNNGTGSFTEVSGLNLNGAADGSGAIADLDGDGKEDILVSGRGISTKLYRNISSTFNGSCIAPTGCNTYTSPSGKYTWTKSGVYIDTLHLADHDSIITVNLLIDKAVAKFTQKTDPDGKYKLLIVNKSSGKHMAYVWNFGDGDSTTAVTPTHTYHNSGDYNLCLTITTGKGCVSKYCEKISLHGKKDGPYTIAVVDSIDGTSALAIKESPVAGGSNLSFDIYPNPTSHTLNVVNNESDEYDMIVRDLSGRQVAFLKNQRGKSTVDMSTLKGGMYFIEIQSKNRVGYYKVLKQ